MKPDSSQSQQKVREKLEPKKKGLKAEKKDPATKKGAKKAKEARSAAAALAGGGPGGSSERPPSLLLPLRQFVDNPCQMIEQLFQAVGREELAAMQPTILQGLPQEEVKQLCLKQLETMTKQEILDILSGCEVKEQKYAVDPSSTANVVTSSTDPTVASDVTKGLEATKTGERLSSVAEASEALELYPATEDMEMLAMDEPPAVISKMSRPPATVPATPGEGDLATNLTKMQMEILELQLRRRAIKALLRSQKGPGEEEDDDDEEEEIVLKEEKG